MTSAVNPTPPNDPLGAFCRENHVALDGASDGPLAGLTFAVKDVFHIAGHRTGFGHPDWLRTHPPAESTALVVQQLLDAGARMVGKTITDELTYSLSGQNVHYGTPVNPAAPDRIPGGSSNGSVSAVAGGLADFALGTDCGGSVRLPASYCGVLGIRPTHGRIPGDGVLPFGPSFDAVGWFARDARVFRAVGGTLLDEDTEAAAPGRLLFAADAFGMVEPRVAECLQPAVAAAAAAVGPPHGLLEQVTVSPEGLDQWYEAFRVIQAYEIWGNLGLWIGETRPEIGPGIRERLDFASRVEPWMVASANEVRKSVRAKMDELLADGDVLCLPTSPRAAPFKDAPFDDLEIRFRQQAMNLLCIAGLAGLPQVSLPLARLDGLPLGLSLVGRRGADRRLLALAEALVPDA